MNPGGSSLGQREQEPNMGLDSNRCSVLEPYHSRMGLISPLAPIPHCAGGRGWVGWGGGSPASAHTAREWLAGARTLGLLRPSPVLFLENISQ